MSLLPAAAARRQVRMQISSLLVTLPKADRRVVLEDLLEDLYSASQPNTEVHKVEAAKSNIGPGWSPAAKGQVLPDQILDWCKAHPREGGIYSVHEVVKVLLPNDERGFSKVYAAVLRSSPQSDREPKPRSPRFEWLGKAKFKLHATGGEEAT